MTMCPKSAFMGECKKKKMQVLSWISSSYLHVMVEFLEVIEEQCKKKKK